MGEVYRAIDTVLGREVAIKVLTRAGLVRPKRIKQWTFYKQDEVRIRELKRTILSSI